MYSENNKIKTAVRLKELRKEKQIASVEKLHEQLYQKYGDSHKIPSVPTLKSLEVRSKDSPAFQRRGGTNIDFISLLADFYEVSIGYLVGETDNRSKGDIDQALSYHGLTERSIKALEKPIIRGDMFDIIFSKMTSINKQIEYTPRSTGEMKELFHEKKTHLKHSDIANIILNDIVLIHTFYELIYEDYFHINQTPSTDEEAAKMRALTFGRLMNRIDALTESIKKESERS